MEENKKIKILWLYRFAENFNFDHFLHLDFAKTISKHEKIELKTYGIGLEKAYPELMVMPYDKKIGMYDLKKEFDFDVIIINTKSRMFENYMPPRRYNDKDYTMLKVEIRENCWLPKDFRKINTTVMKIVLEEDYHWEENDSWYREMGIHLILQRHYSQTFRTMATPKIWFPFSVDTTVFKPDPNIERIKKIGFIGCDVIDCYPYRAMGTNILKSLGLLDKIGDFQIKIKDDNYVNYLKKYVSFFNGSSKVNVNSAKMFEIMASGALLFTNKPQPYALGYGLKQLFPEDAYCTYEENFSDLVDKAKMIIENEEYVKKTTEKALRCINERHSHRVRINELINIIEREHKNPKWIKKEEKKDENN